MCSFCVETCYSNLKFPAMHVQATCPFYKHIKFLILEFNVVQIFFLQFLSRKDSMTKFNVILIFHNYPNYITIILFFNVIYNLIYNL